MTGRIRAVGLVLLVFSALAPVISPAGAGDEKRHFSIPAQPMASALISFSEQAELQILVAAGLVDHGRSTDVSGRFAPSEALSILIGSEPLRFRFVAERTIAITGTDPESSGNQPQIPAQRPTALP